jgi:ankyrin repeat protein
MSEMPFEYPDVSIEYVNNIYVLNDSRLILQIAPDSEFEFDDVDNGELPKVISFPSSPCTSLQEFKKATIQLPGDFPCKRKMELSEDVVQILEQSNIISEWATPDYRSHTYIHRTAYAILQANDEEGRLGFVTGGIFFMSMRNMREPRLLRYFPMSLTDKLNDNDICSAPQRVWLTSVQSLYYFGPSTKDQPKLVCDEPDGLMGRMLPAIWMACNGNALGALKFMKEDMQGMDINTESPWAGRTMLHYAALKNKPDAVKILIEAHANVDQTDGHGMTPLMLAVAAICPECVKVLCKNGADPNHEDGRKESVILKLADSEWDQERTMEDADEVIVQVLDLLTSFKADVNAVDCIGRSILSNPCVVHNCDTIRKLVQLNADPTIKDKGGRSLINLCLEQKEEKNVNDVLRMMVNELKLDINDKDDLGRTALSAMVFMLSEDDVRFLVQELKADVTIRDIDSKTAYERYYTEMLRAKDKRPSSVKIAQLLKGSG